MSLVNPARHGTYVVTYDVASRLQSYRSGGLRILHQHDQMFGEFHRQLLEKLRIALPNVHIYTISMNKIRRRIWKQVEQRIQDMSGQVVLSTCQEIADTNPKSEGLCLQINRLFNTDGEMIGHGPRPGFKHLNEQFRELGEKIAGRSVVLIEDGAFTGSTLRYVLSRLSEMNLRVTAVIIGFCCTRALDVVKSAFDGELVIVDPLENLIDWIPDHDLIPFVPNCGRVLGEAEMPIITASGASCAYPYILPFGKMEKWATVPPEGARDLSQFCLDTSIEIFGRIGRNGTQLVTIGDLLKACPRVSLPIKIGLNEAMPTLETQVHTFLKQARKRLG